MTTGSGRSIDNETEQLSLDIARRSRRVTSLLRQSAMMSQASKGFNAAEQKADAANICRELDDEAAAENEIISQLKRRYFSLLKDEK